MNGPRIRVVLAGTSGLLAGMLSRALANVPQDIGVVALKDGDTIELGPEDVVVLCDPQVREVSMEQLKVFDAAILDIARELPAKSHGHHAGTAFYNNLPHYRRRDKRRARKN